MSKEIETKVEVSEQGFARLLSVCRLLRRDDQLNVYYDFENRLAGQSATLRVRYQKSAQPKVALKIPVHVQGGCRTAIEVEEPLSRRTKPGRSMLVDRDLAPSLRPYLRELGLPRVERVGAMRTCRVTAELPGGVVVELDRVELPGGGMFYEVEVENPDPTVHDRALVAIKEVVDDFSFSQLSKFERFLRATAARKVAPPGGNRLHKDESE